jgi:hypothetical protein
MGSWLGPTRCPMDPRSLQLIVQAPSALSTPRQVFLHWALLVLETKKFKLKFMK